MMIKFFAISLPEKVFLSIAELDGNQINTLSAINNLYFDGVKGKKTFKRNWIELESLPKEVKKLKSEVKRLTSFHLKDGYIPSEALPKELPPDYFNDENEENTIYKLYDMIFEIESPETFIDIEFSVTILASKDSGWTFHEIPDGVKHSILDELMIHPDLLQDAPCELTREESYRIIRSYVKNYINPSFARISSDYDFCFSVEKNIPLSEKEEYIINIGKKKPKFETRFRDFRRILCFSMAPRAYQDYPIVEPFRGNSYEDLKKNIECYLEDLITKINEALVDCPHCNARGVILLSNDINKTKI